MEKRTMIWLAVLAVVIVVVYFIMSAIQNTAFDYFQKEPDMKDSFGRAAVTSMLSLMRLNREEANHADGWFPVDAAATDKTNSAVNLRRWAAVTLLTEVAEPQFLVHVSETLRPLFVAKDGDKKIPYDSFVVKRDEAEKAAADAHPGNPALAAAKAHVATLRIVAEMSKAVDGHTFEVSDEVAALLEKPTNDALLEYAEKHTDASMRVAEFLRAYNNRQQLDVDQDLITWLARVFNNTGVIGTLRVMSIPSKSYISGINAVCYDTMSEELRSIIDEALVTKYGKGESCVIFGRGANLDRLVLESVHMRLTDMGKIMVRAEDVAKVAPRVASLIDVSVTDDLTVDAAVIKYEAELIRAYMGHYPVERVGMHLTQLGGTMLKV